MIVTSKSYFLDSNIWLYALLKSPNPSQRDLEKQQTADLLIDSPNVVISTQVINEVCSNLMRKANFNEHQIKRLI